MNSVESQMDDSLIVKALHEMPMPEITGSQIVDEEHVIIKVDINYNNTLSPRVFEIVRSHGWYVRAVKITHGQILVHLHKLEADN